MKSTKPSETPYLYPELRTELMYRYWQVPDSIKLFLFKRFLENLSYFICNFPELWHLTLYWWKHNGWEWAQFGLWSGPGGPAGSTACRPAAWGRVRNPGQQTEYLNVRKHPGNQTRSHITGTTPEINRNPFHFSYFQVWTLTRPLQPLDSFPFLLFCCRLGV